MDIKETEMYVMKREITNELTFLQYLHITN